MRLRWLTIHAAELKAGARMAPNESSWSWRRIFWGRDLWRKALVALELGPMPLQKVWRRRSCCTGKRAFQAFRTLSLTWPVWWARGHHPSCSHYKQTQPSLPPSLGHLGVASCAHLSFLSLCEFGHYLTTLLSAYCTWHLVEDEVDGP